jgi:hypothetical protein
MLSMMAKSFFSESALLVLPIVSLIIFMVVFSLITIQALRIDKEKVRTMAALPLAEDLNRAPRTS